MADSDRKSTVLELMKVMAKSNKFMHMNDIFQPLATKMRQDELDVILQQLCEDGVIYSSYAKDIYSVTEM
jgi:energy-converting hydrogenase A subunit M